MQASEVRQIQIRPTQISLLSVPPSSNAAEFQRAVLGDRGTSIGWLICSRDTRLLFTSGGLPRLCFFVLWISYDYIQRTSFTSKTTMITTIMMLL